MIKERVLELGLGPDPGVFFWGHNGNSMGEAHFDNYDAAEFPVIFYFFLLVPKHGVDDSSIDISSLDLQ